MSQTMFFVLSLLLGATSGVFAAMVRPYPRRDSMILGITIGFATETILWAFTFLVLGGIR